MFKQGCAVWVDAQPEQLQQHPVQPIGALADDAMTGVVKAHELRAGDARGQHVAT